MTGGAGKFLASPLKGVRSGTVLGRKRVGSVETSAVKDVSVASKKRRRKSEEYEFAGAAEEQTALDQYLKEVSRHKLLTAQEEIELGRRARAGDEDAVQQLVRSNLRFVISVAKKY